jgi:hypothetical protein
MFSCVYGRRRRFALRRNEGKSAPRVVMFLTVVFVIVAFALSPCRPHQPSHTHRNLHDACASGGLLSFCPPITWSEGPGTRATHVDWLVRCAVASARWRRFPRVPAIVGRRPRRKEVFHSGGRWRRRRSGSGLLFPIPGSSPRFHSHGLRLSSLAGRQTSSLDRIALASRNRCTTALQQRRWGECKSAQAA